MAEFQLAQRLIELSVSTRWDEAKLEWALENVWHEKDPDTCLCGHFPINEICQLRNQRNRKTAIVGNCCVKKFTHLPSDLIFQAVKRVSGDIEKSLNPETIDHAHKKGWISEWDYNFYFDTWRKRVLSGKQLEVRIKINNKILPRIVHARRNA